MATFYIHRQRIPFFGEVDQLIMVGDDGIVWWVPNDEGNRSYQQYLAWVELGNIPEEWSPNAN